MLRFVLALCPAVVVSPALGRSVRRRSRSGAECERSSECRSPLVCPRVHGRNERATSGDCREGLSCPPGATCVGRSDGTRACLDPSTRSCVWNSDCAATANEFVCAFDQRCRLECRIGADPSDCRFGDLCATLSFDEGDAGVAVGNFCVPSPAMGSGAAGAPDAGP